VFLWPLLGATIGFSLIFGGLVLARMRAILADIQAEARLRRKAMAGPGNESVGRGEGGGEARHA